MTPAEPFTFVLALIVGVLAVTRVTRLIVDDSYPPMERVREWYVSKVPERWMPLVECPWCAAPYVTLPAVGWFALLVAFPSWTAVVWVWWIVNGWAAVSWLAAFLTLRDEPPD